VVDRASRQDDGIDLVAGNQLGVAAVRDSERPTELLCTARPRGRHNHQLGPGGPPGVLGMHCSHPAEAGDAEPQRRPRP
jgi:hypothetical protein